MVGEVLVATSIRLGGGVVDVPIVAVCGCRGGDGSRGAGVGGGVGEAGLDIGDAGLGGGSGLAGGCDVGAVPEQILFTTARFTF